MAIRQEHVINAKTVAGYLGYRLIDVRDKRDMPMFTREFSDAFHLEKTIWVWLDRGPGQSLHAHSTLWHELGHAVTAKGACRFGRDWMSPSIYRLCEQRFAGLSRLEQDKWYEHRDRVETLAVDAQLRLMQRSGVDRAMQRDVQKSMNGDMKIDPETAALVDRVWAAAFAKNSRR